LFSGYVSRKVTLLLVVGRKNLPPTLDHVRWEILSSFAGGLAGVASRRMKFYRRFIANRTVRTNLVIVSTPSLAFLACLFEALEPVRVQALGSELTVEAFDERIVGRFARS
jgi:hypothetical protein